AENQAAHLEDAMLRRLSKRRQMRLEADIRLLDKRLAEMVAANVALAQRYELLTSMPGVGPVLAFTLIALLPELGKMSRSAIAGVMRVAGGGVEQIGRSHGRADGGGGVQRPQRRDKAPRWLGADKGGGKRDRPYQARLYRDLYQNIAGTEALCIKPKNSKKPAPNGHKCAHLYLYHPLEDENPSRQAKGLAAEGYRKPYGRLVRTRPYTARDPTRALQLAAQMSKAALVLISRDLWGGLFTHGGQ